MLDPFLPPTHIFVQRQTQARVTLTTHTAVHRHDHVPAPCPTVPPSPRHLVQHHPQPVDPQQPPAVPEVLPQHRVAGEHHVVGGQEGGRAGALGAVVRVHLLTRLNTKP